MTQPVPAVLAMEVSQRHGGIALRCPDGTIVQNRLTSTTRRGDALMPAIESMLMDAQVSPRDLSGIGVTIGPGGFTGLRIGLAAAKMLGWALEIPIASVPTALLAAETDRESEARYAVALASKDDTCWLSLIEGKQGHRALLEGAEGGRLVHADAFQTGLEGVTCLLADDHLPDSMSNHGLPARAPDFDPVVLLKITERFLAEGRTTDPLDLLPIYPRDPEAVRLWDARKSG